MKPDPSQTIGDSTIFWFGSIPNDWKIARAWTIFAERKEFSSNGEESLLSVSEYYGVKPRADVKQDDEFESRAESLEGYRLCYAGDLVMNYMLAWKGSHGVTQYKGIVSPAYAVFKFMGEHDPSYFHYLLRTPAVCMEFKRFSSGVIDSRLRLYPCDFLHQIKLPVPSLVQQQTIAAFLDRETARIDTLIAKQERLIALLHEKRQAVISHAVTKGLDLKVPMKDSGIAWLGEVPAHWEVRRLKYCLTGVKAGPFGSSLTKDMYVSDGYRVYGQEQVIPDNFDIGDYFIDSNTFGNATVKRVYACALVCAVFLPLPGGRPRRFLATKGAGGTR